MKEIESNKQAWSLLAEDHYNHFKKRFLDNTLSLNQIIVKELGDITGKKVLHLQCNTGADSILLAKMGAIVTGVDLVPENAYYAEKLAEELQITNVNFIESDIMTLMEKHQEKYDIVFTSEGAVGWLPDLIKWGHTIRHFLKEDGFFYVNDSHPIYLIFDEEKIQNEELTVKYPYFKKDPDEDNYIGGYASDSKEGKNYFWGYTISEIINALANAGLFIEYFNEYDVSTPGMGGSVKDESGLYCIPYFKGKLPITFSLKASVR